MANVVSETLTRYRYDKPASGADNAVYDPTRKYCYVENRGPDPAADSNLLSIIDTKTSSTWRHHPSGQELAGHGHRAFR